MNFLSAIHRKIRLYPQGDSVGSGQYVSLYLYCANLTEPTKVNANFSIGMKNHLHFDGNLSREGSLLIFHSGVTRNVK